jgi:hypothetical protein
MRIKTKNMVNLDGCRRLNKDCMYQSIEKMNISDNTIMYRVKEELKRINHGN